MILQMVAHICFLTPLPFLLRWMVTSWSPCTRSCGGGIQTRRVTCQRLTAKGSSVPMSNEACVQVSKRPMDTQNCNRQPCVEWVASSWGQVRNKPGVQGQLQCRLEKKLSENEKSDICTLGCLDCGLLAFKEASNLLNSFNSVFDELHGWISVSPCKTYKCCLWEGLLLQTSVFSSVKNLKHLSVVSGDTSEA